DAAEHADKHAEWNADPWRDAEFHESNGHCVTANAEKRRVAKRDHTAIAAQHVPRDASSRPDHPQRHDQLIIRILHVPADEKINGSESEDREVLPAQFAPAHQS